jgi:hypothetical protein
MKTVNVNETGEEFQLISCYADLRKRDVIKLMRLAYLNPLNVAVRLGLLRQLVNAPETVWAKLERHENHDQVLRLLQTLEWVWKGPDHRPIPFVRIRGKNFLLPDEDLHLIGTAEFVIATAHLIGFYSAKDDSKAKDCLAKFMATIIRPKPDVMERIRKEGSADLREGYNSVKAERRIKLFAKVDLVTQIMIAQWFNNAGNRLMATYGMKSDDTDQAPISQGIFVQDWERQVVRVAQSQVYGNYDKVMERPLTDVLAYIEIKNEEIRTKNRKNQ